MSSAVDKKVWLADMFGALTKSPEENQKVYADFASQYDEAFTANGFTLPQQLSKLCMENITEETRKNLKDCIALDVCSGTGLSAKAMIEAGFTGSIDGVDGSAEMITIAKSKKFHRNIMQHLILPDSPLPIPDDTYDVVMLSGGLSLGHLPHECLRELGRVLKPGGMMVFNSTHFNGTDPSGKGLNTVQEVLTKLKEEGKLEVVREVKSQIFDTDFQYHMTTYVVLHCYTKRHQQL